MKYRHAYHAGNFADVHKHLVLIALLRLLKRKDKGFLYLDTHAGRGLYDLESVEARRSDEASAGITRLLDEARLDPPLSAPMHEDLDDYLQTVRSIRSQTRSRSAYPGSPLIALSHLRAQDRAVLVETQESEHRALREALRSVSSSAKTSDECADGYARVASWLPPIERRALVLIDPPYENASEDLRRVRSTLQEALRRLPHAVIAVWYPIASGRDTDREIAAHRGELPAPPDAEMTATLLTEWWIRPRESPLGLNGSGLLIVNPPWGLDERLRADLAALQHHLDPQHAGGWYVG